MKTLIVNFYGGPGTGKSTMAARVFSELKEMGLNVELATEYAKDLTWQESFEVLANQLYVFAKQQHRIWRLNFLMLLTVICIIIFVIMHFLLGIQVEWLQK